VSQRDWKAVQIPFEPISSASEDVSDYSLSERTNLILLALTGQAHWQTRWFKEGELSDAEKLLIEDWASTAEHQLLNGAAAPDPPPPYWDETKPEEAGNENPTETGFPWYEDLSFTFIEGFLATLVSPPAAYAYITVIKKLRLFFIYGQHGALFDIQVDGTTVQTVDTYAPTEAVGVVDVVIP
jgi:hypothetical protein